MAESFPKEILPYFEGKRGELTAMRFWSKVDMRGPDQCWEWQASLHTTGYGRFKIASYRTVMASRVALVITHKEDRLDRFALHTCDNRKCCNPHHLYWGTQKQNMRDMHERGRENYPDQSGFNNGAAKLDERQLATIVNRLRAGWNNKQIAADMPVTHSLISLIRLGRLWRKEAELLGWSPVKPFVGRRAVQ